MATSKRNLAKFEDVKQFFKSWGMYPGDEHSDMLADELNPDAIANGLNRKCYEKLVEDARRQIQASGFPDYFPNFCRRIIDATDDQFYLDVTTWEELEEAWDEHIAGLKSS